MLWSPFDWVLRHHVKLRLVLLQEQGRLSSQLEMAEDPLGPANGMIPFLL